MAIIKYIAVHQSPMKFLKYVVNGSKTADMKFVTGIACSENSEAAYLEMSLNYECYAKERFFKNEFPEQEENFGDYIKPQRERILLHHYIQSFAKGEVTPAEAHEIGVEWAKKVFGENRHVLVSTHCDKSHIHNHIAVAKYDLDGKVWYANKESLKRCRDISDSICKAHGLSVIEKPQHKANQKYGDWLARNTRASWKQKLCDDIDEIILREDVHSVEDLAARLKEKGYIPKLGKYLSIKVRNDRKPIRSYRLGDGYAIEELRYRIENKDKEMSLAVVAQYDGIQREYAMCLRELQIIVYRKPESQYRASYRELRQNAELLCYLSDRNIRSDAEFEKIVNTAAEKSDELKKKCAELQEKIGAEGKIAEDGGKYLELRKVRPPTPDILKQLRELNYLNRVGIMNEGDLETHRQELDRLKAELPKAQEQLEAAEAEKKEAAQNYQTYLRQRQTDYDFIYEKLRREKEELEKAERQIERERESNTPERTRNKKNIGE